MFYFPKIVWGIIQPSSIILVFLAAGGFFAAAGICPFGSGAVFYALSGFFFDILAWPVDFKTSGFRGSWRLLPKGSDGLKRANSAANEWVGLGAAWMLGYISWP